MSKTELLSRNRVILCHFDDYSHALVFPRWAHGMLWPQALPEGAQALSSPPEPQPAAIDSAALITTVLQGSDLNTDDIEEVTAFQPWFQTPEGPLRVHLLRFTTPADAVVSSFFRQNRALGARERQTLAETVYEVLRRRLMYQHLAQVAAQLLLRLQGVLQIALVQLAGGKEAFAQPPLDRGFDSGNRFHEVIGGRHCRGLSTVAASPAKGIACDTQGRRLPVINCYARNRAARCCAAR